MVARDRFTAAHRCGDLDGPARPLKRARPTCEATARRSLAKRCANAIESPAHPGESGQGVPETDCASSLTWPQVSVDVRVPVARRRSTFPLPSKAVQEMWPSVSPGSRAVRKTSPPFSTRVHCRARDVAALLHLGRQPCARGGRTLHFRPQPCARPGPKPEPRSADARDTSGRRSLPAADHCTG